MSAELSEQYKESAENIENADEEVRETNEKKSKDQFPDLYIDTRVYQSIIGSKLSPSKSGEKERSNG